MELTLYFYNYDVIKTLALVKLPTVKPAALGAISCTGYTDADFPLATPSNSTAATTNTFACNMLLPSLHVGCTGFNDLWAPYLYEKSTNFIFGNNCGRLQI